MAESNEQNDEDRPSIPVLHPSSPLQGVSPCTELLQVAAERALVVAVERALVTEAKFEAQDSDQTSASRTSLGSSQGQLAIDEHRAIEVQEPAPLGDESNGDNPVGDWIHNLVRLSAITRLAAAFNLYREVAPLPIDPAEWTPLDAGRNTVNQGLTSVDAAMNDLYLDFFHPDTAMISIAGERTVAGVVDLQQEAPSLVAPVVNPENRVALLGFQERRVRRRTCRKRARRTKWPRGMPL